jgi:type II secretory pathway pseudopilin PulG
MYAAIWRLLPGPLWVRILLVLVLVAVVLYSLATWVFPWVDTMVNDQEVTVGAP